MRTALTTSRSAVRALGRGASAPGWAILIVGSSALSWWTMLVSMPGLAGGPETPLHALIVFLLGWVVMLTAMMLPSELNYVAAFAILLKGRAIPARTRHRRVLAFLSGYAVAWIGYGLIAFAVDAAIRATGSAYLSWNRTGTLISGSVLITAGLFQVSALKHACLKGCRSPLWFFARYWRPGDMGAVRMGVRHGMVCVGCCWALMAVMFAVGSMSLVWMALLTLFMFAEKMFPNGQRLTLPIARFLWIMGAWIVIAPPLHP